MKLINVMRSVRNLFERALSWAYTKYIWGPRCSTFEPGCIVCKRWAEHDEMFDAALAERGD